jgi:hypothetical protein
MSDPHSAAPDDVLALQQHYGNRAVQRLIQARLSVGPVGDKYEQEADRVADQVMHMTTPSTSRQALQRADEDEAVQLKSSIQPVQGDGGFEVKGAVEARLAQRQGGGAPLSNDVQAFMGSRFDTDFSRVRVHTDREAAQLNRDLQAQAFTHGTDIYLGEGKYNPGTSAGKRLLAHELTHVVQQTDGLKPLRRAAKSNTDKRRDRIQHIPHTPPKSIVHRTARQIQRLPQKLTNAQLSLIVNVDDNLLDQGSKLLKALNRPNVVNDAKADKLSNCALTTLAAIESGKTSGGVASSLRSGQGLPATSEQSQKIWAMTLADAETLAAKKMVTPAATLGADEMEKNKELIKGMEDFAEGNAYVVADAQYYGMIQYLMGLAAKGATSDVKFKVFEYGEPGNDMHAEASLVSAMNQYPNGTRFAVFLYSPDPTQHVRQHWVYAERFNNQVLFKDYQVNTGARNPVDVYLNEFPFSPDVRSDVNKSFGQGSFIAYVPFFTNQPAPIVPGREANPDKIGGIISEVKGKMRVLKEPMTAPGERMSTQWPSMGNPLTEIPAPSVIDQGVRSIGSKFGLTVVCQYGSLTNQGVIQIIGNPVHSNATIKKTKRVKIPGQPGLQDVEEQVPTDQIKFQPLNAAMPVKQPGQPAQIDPRELPAPATAKADTETQYREAFAKAYQISAQNVTGGIQINALNAEFVDLIHEATHSFEQVTLPMHFREGLTEIFASMVAQQVQTSSGDVRFEYVYNPTYGHYTAAMQKLVDVLGLPVLARLYFATTDYKTFLDNEIKQRVPSTSHAQVPDIRTKLLNFEAFPSDFKVGLHELQQVITGAATYSTDEASLKANVYDVRQGKFGQYVTTESQRLGQKYNRAISTGTDQLDAAVGIDRWASVETAEKRLKILYLQKSEATGSQFTSLMKLIDGHEQSIREATGESPYKLRKRLLPGVPITFETQYHTEPGQDVYVNGDAPELGNWNENTAVKMHYGEGGAWRANVTFPATGMSLNYKYFFKQKGRTTWESPKLGEHHTRVLPTRPMPVHYKDNWGNVAGL